MTTIIGAGMAGLLAGCMLGPSTEVWEAAPTLPNNHHALLRFRNDEISSFLNIPFKQVDVIKHIVPWRNPVADAVSYSYKCTEKITSRSLLSVDGEIKKRYIAPPDFIQQMFFRINGTVQFSKTVDKDALMALCDEGPVISTMPMPVLMDLLEWPDKPEFEYMHGSVIEVNNVDGPRCDLCATIYYPDPEFMFTRATLTENRIQIELPRLKAEEIDDDLRRQTVSTVKATLGLINWPNCEVKIHNQKFAKILPIDDRARKRFMMHATDTHGIFSLGRFATWKPGLLLDDVFKDVRQIQKMIHSGTYHHRLSLATE